MSLTPINSELHFLVNLKQQADRIQIKLMKAELFEAVGLLQSAERVKVGSQYTEGL